MHTNTHRRNNLIHRNAHSHRNHHSYTQAYRHIHHLLCLIHSLSHLQEEEDDDDDSDDEMDETALESFTTPLDREDCEVDEYCVFKDVMQSESMAGWQGMDRV